MDQQQTTQVNPAPAKESRSGRPSNKPIQLKVEETLYYLAEIADRTDITLQEASGAIEVIFPAPASGKSRPLSSTRQTRAGYLALSDYDATIWQPPLPGEGIPLKIPITGPPPEIEIGSSLKLPYKINSESSHLSTGPVLLDVKIVDRTSTATLQSSLAFVEGLRLEITVSSTIDPFSEVDAEKVAQQVRSQIEKYQQKEKKLKSRLGSKADNPAITDKIQAGAQKILGSSSSPNEETPVDETKLTQTLEKVQARRQEYEALLEGQQSNRLRDHEFITGVRSLWVKDRSPAFTELIDYMQHKVKLASLSVKNPYLRPALATRLEWRLEREDAQTWSQLVGTHADDAEETAWEFNPEQSALEIKNSHLSWNENTRMHEIRTYLDLDPPSTGSDQLTGSVILYVDEPLSNLKVGWTKSKKGEVDYSRTGYRTWLVLDFVINFADVFRQRSFFLERKLHFEGVVYHSDHVINISHILNNQGLIVLPIADKSPAGQAEHDSKQSIIKEITAVRQGPELDIVQIRIASQVREGTHSISYNNREERLSKSVSLGAVDIQLLARMTGQSEAINQLLNTLQMDLEHYFTSSMVRTDKESA